nr:hypothetical protein [Tanacetum cinerariifolium]
MQQFWYTIKKVKNTESYEFLLANKKCIVDVEVFRKILDIYPRVKGDKFTEVHDDDATLTFIIDLGYKVLLHKYTSMYVDHMHQPWRTLAAIINKCLSRKTESNDRLRKSKIDILLKFVRIREDYQIYGLPIPDMMLNDKIKQLESYQMFLKYSTGLIPPKKSREQEAADTMQALKESKKTSRRQSGTKGLSKGTGRILGVPGESTVVSTASSEGTDSQLNSDEEEKKDNDGDVDDEDEDDDHISDIQDTNDEDAKTESEDDEIYKYKIQVHKDVDTTEEKGDAELVRNAMTSDYQFKVSTKLPLPSSSLSVSSGFVLKVPVSVILETTTLPPIPEIPTETLVSIALSPPHVTHTISNVQQTTTSIPTPPTTTKPLTITTAVLEFVGLFVVQLRVAKLEKDVSELEKIYHTAEALAFLKSYVTTVVENYLGSKICDDLQKVLQRYTLDLIQKYSIKPTPEPSKI